MKIQIIDTEGKVMISWDDDAWGCEYLPKKVIPNIGDYVDFIGIDGMYRVIERHMSFPKGNITIICKSC